jgi:hypothetical protein
MLDRPTLSHDSPMVRSDSACWLPRRLYDRLYASLRPTQVALGLRSLMLPEERLNPVSAAFRPYLPRWPPGSRIAPWPLRHLTVSRGLHREIPPTEVRAFGALSLPTQICQPPDPVCWSSSSVARAFPPAHGVAEPICPAPPPAATASQYLLARRRRSHDRSLLAGIWACAFRPTHGCSELAR